MISATSLLDVSDRAWAADQHTRVLHADGEFFCVNTRAPRISACGILSAAFFCRARQQLAHAQDPATQCNVGR